MIETENLVVKRCIPCDTGPAADHQNKLYGKNMRVHNRTMQAKPASTQKLRCSICGKES